MNSVSGDPVFSVPNAIGSGGGSSVDLSNYPDLEDATLTQANTIPVFETTGQKRLKLTTFEAGDFDARITTNTQNISTGQSNVDVLTTNFNTHAASQEFHANVGKSGQGINAVALGSSAAQSAQGRDSVAVGVRAGENTQGVQAVAVGSAAGKDGQGQDAIAIGYSAASQGQGAYAVAIGSVAANTGQGDHAIAVGYQAAAASQNARSICVNATGSAITANQEGFFVAPVRDENTDVSGKVMCYDTTTKEIVLRNQPTVTETVFDFDGSLNPIFYDDGAVKFSWGASVGQIRWNATNFAGIVNVGQQLTKGSAFGGVLTADCGRFTQTSGTVYFFSSDGLRKSAFDMDITGNYFKGWLSGGSTPTWPHYTIEAMCGQKSTRVFGVVRRYNH